jgi:hypothetical protein
MKRRAFKLVVFLLLGAIVNIAVAWALSLAKGSMHDTSRRFTWFSQEKLRWTALAEKERSLLHDAGWSGSDADGAVLALVSRVDSWGWQDVTYYPWVEMRVVGYHPDRGHVPTLAYALRLSSTQAVVTQATNGWPRRSFHAHQYHYTDKATHANSIELPTFGGLLRKDRGYIVPIAPIWPGFAINTLFYAAILWMLFTAPFALRRRRRIKRGLCPACAYPVGASDVCTECGTVHQRSGDGRR